jgi:hypothetical protein
MWLRAARGEEDVPSCVFAAVLMGPLGSGLGL